MTHAARITSALFAASAATILLAAITVTQAIAAGAPMWLRLLFRPICHGMPSRCFHWSGVPLPLCARCTGLYLGFLAGIGLFAAVRKLQRELIPSWAVLLLIAPLVIDGVTQGLGLRESTNELRVYTGFVAGAAALAWVMNRIQSRCSELSGQCSEVEHRALTTEH